MLIFFGPFEQIGRRIADNGEADKIDVVIIAVEARIIDLVANREARRAANLYKLPQPGQFIVSSELEEIAIQARELDLFEPMLDAQIQRAFMFKHDGRDREARAARRSALQLASTHGWDIFWALSDQT